MGCVIVGGDSLALFTALKKSKEGYIRYTLQLIKLIKSVTSLVLKKANAIVCVFYEKRRPKRKGEPLHLDAFSRYSFSLEKFRISSLSHLCLKDEQKNKRVIILKAPTENARNKLGIFVFELAVPTSTSVDAIV